MKRRTLLKLAGASLLLPSLPVLAGPTDERLVVVLLRGGLDGLDAVPPIGDPDYETIRGRLALDDALDLDGFFGLNPALAELMPLWKAGELLPVHAVALPYRKRSHFDAQDLMETAGGLDGWLSRALVSTRREGLALGSGLPRVLRGSADVSSLDPDREVREDDEVLELVQQLYEQDPLLGPALEAGVQAQLQIDSEPSKRSQRRRRRQDFPRIARVAAEILRDPVAPSALVIDTGGWDTHARQRSRLDDLLVPLGSGLAALAEELGPMWSRTTVLVMTEFGRTAKPNGTQGTDHGTGGVSLVLGGSIRGGRVIADWPGLDALHDGRDLAPTTDLRSVIRGALRASIGGDQILSEVEALRLT